MEKDGGKEREDEMEKDGTGGPEREGLAGGPGAEEQLFRAEGEPASSGDRPGPTWRGWVVSILVAIILSVTATLLLGGSFGSDRLLSPGACATGPGGPCCPPAGK
ncbi:MAG: hypothetical protein M1550_06590 [Deltaproteobacteria bacterium]|nr:hypothetical protein [Deltaproteobacteria bacterium]